MPNFNGQLNVNEVYGSIYNMIISQQVFSDDIFTAREMLADKSRTDGGLYGDSKLFYATDVLKSYDWLGDSEAQNLLKLHRPQDPECQVITIDQFRIIPLTTDEYLTKRAWSTQDAFSAFNSRMLGWMRDTKRIYDATLFNSFIGTNQTTVGKQVKQIAIPAEPADANEVNTEAYNRIKAQTIATEMAKLIVNIEDISRDYNDYGNLRSFNANDLLYVWNADVVSEIRKLDLPTIFNKDGLVDKFAQNSLPARFFGNVNASSGTTGATNLNVRSLIEKDYNAVEPHEEGYDPKKHIFPGDLLPANTSYGANETYTQDNSIICKIYKASAVPFMTAFETGTSFFNRRSLTQTNFLIWGYNKLEHLKNYPFITVKQVVSA